MAKRKQLDCTIIFPGYDVFAGGADVNCQTQFSKFHPKFGRDTVEPNTFGPPLKQAEKGQYDLTIEFELRPDAASDFSIWWSQEFDKDGNTEFRYRPRNAAIAADNWEYAGEMLITDDAPAGAARAEILTTSGTARINTAVTVSDHTGIIRTIASANP